MTKKKPNPPAEAVKTETVTCRHCRYERPAADARCHICGYPWPWLEKKAKPSKRKAAPRRRR